MKVINGFINQIIILSLLICLNACVDEPAPEPVICPGEVGRTVLVYMVASNNLGIGKFDQADIEEMQKAADAGGVAGGRLLVYHVPASGDPVLKEVRRGGIDTLAVYDSSESSVSSGRMRRVFADTKALAPARDYGLVLWSHASGWLQDGMDDEIEAAPQPKAFGYDKGQKMNITALARTLEGEDFSFVYFDCCYMGAVEVAYELRDATEMIVASPSELPSAGMPYDLNVPCFFAAEPDLVQAARNTFDCYDAMGGSSRTCTMSVVRTEGMSRLAAAVRDIYLHAEESWPEGYEPQRYMTETRCYHFDLEYYIEALCDDSGMLEEFRSALSAVVLYEDATDYLWSRLPIESHCGLSTFIFTGESQTAMKNYDTTSWYRDVASALNK
ncbi:MAG: hypothetical protein K2I56_10680 [Muribaculaceae bacterium]|nr:hypothetical protein [Muribaculaceae bacterium]